VGSKAKPVFRQESPVLSRNCKDNFPSQDARQKRLNHTLADRRWRQAIETLNTKPLSKRQGLYVFAPLST